MYNLLRSIRKERFIRYGKGTALCKEALSLRHPCKAAGRCCRSFGPCTHHHRHFGSSKCRFQRGSRGNHSFGTHRTNSHRIRHGTVGHYRGRKVTTEPTEQAAEQTAEPTEETTAETTVPETTRPKVTGSTGQNTSVSPTKPTASGGTHTPDDGHTHGNYYDIPHLKANCTNPGTVYRQCGYCNRGMEIPDPVNYPPLGHDYYANIVVPPTTTSQGYTVCTCRRCGDSYDSDFTDPLPTEAPHPSEDASPATPESET